MSESRACTKCKEVFPRTPEFFKTAKRMKDGLSSWCRGCHNRKNLERYHADPEPILEKQRAYFQATREARVAANREWRRKNPERARAADAAYRERNREHLRSYHAEWWKKNSERVAEYARFRTAVRSAAARGAVGCAEEQAVRGRVEVWGERCWMCGKPWECIDHVIPVKRGGTNWPANLRPACRSCNARKSSKSHLGIPTYKRRRTWQVGGQQRVHNFS